MCKQFSYAYSVTLSFYALTFHASTYVQSQNIIIIINIQYPYFFISKGSYFIILRSDPLLYN